MRITHRTKPYVPMVARDGRCAKPSPPPLLAGNLGCRTADVFVLALTADHASRITAPSALASSQHGGETACGANACAFPRQEQWPEVQQVPLRAVAAPSDATELSHE